MDEHQAKMIETDQEISYIVEERSTLSQSQNLYIGVYWVVLLVVSIFSSAIYSMQLLNFWSGENRIFEILRPSALDLIFYCLPACFLIVIWFAFYQLTVFLNYSLLLKKHVPIDRLSYIIKLSAYFIAVFWIYIVISMIAPLIYYVILRY